MIQCIQFRKSSFLGTSEWLTRPWDGANKDVYQKLFDKGFALAALLEEMDRVTFFSFDTSTQTLYDYLHRCSKVGAELEAWYEELLLESSSPLYWTVDSANTTTSSSGWNLSDPSEPQKLPPFSFPNLRLGCIVTNFWGLKLILSNTIALTCSTILSISNHRRDQSLHTRPTLDPKSMAQRLLTQHGAANQLELATNIMRSMPYCLNDNMGLLGAQKSLFALRVALLALRRHPGEELKWCQAVYQEFDDRKGLRYAREMAKLDKNFTAAGRDSPPMGVLPRHGIDAG